SSGGLNQMTAFAMPLSLTNQVWLAFSASLPLRQNLPSDLCSNMTGSRLGNFGDSPSSTTLPTTLAVPGLIVGLEAACLLLSPPLSVSRLRCLRSLGVSSLPQPLTLVSKTNAGKINNPARSRCMISPLVLCLKMNHVLQLPKSEPHTHSNICADPNLTR